MKKVIALALALMMCLSAIAVAEKIVPSKTTGDLVQVETTLSGNVKPNQNVVIQIVPTLPVVSESTEGAEGEEVPAVEEPVEIVEKKKEAVTVTNAELTKLTAAIAAVAAAAAPAPVVDETTGEPTGEVVELTEEEKKEVAKAQTKVVEEYFGPVVSSASGESLSLTQMLDTETVTVDEFFPMVVSGLEAGCGNATMTLSAAAVYTAEDKVLVLVGIVAADGAIVWHACEATVTEDGRVQTEFPEELLLAMQAGTALVSIVRG